MLGEVQNGEHLSSFIRIFSAGCVYAVESLSVEAIINYDFFLY